MIWKENSFSAWDLSSMSSFTELGIYSFHSFSSFIAEQLPKHKDYKTMLSGMREEYRQVCLSCIFSESGKESAIFWLSAEETIRFSDCFRRCLNNWNWWRLWKCRWSNCTRTKSSRRSRGDWYVLAFQKNELKRFHFIISVIIVSFWCIFSVNCVVSLRNQWLVVLPSTTLLVCNDSSCIDFGFSFFFLTFFS
jgi:hypothetical protein